jgi:hypothetical protein
MDSLANVYLDQGEMGAQTQSLYIRALPIFVRVHGNSRSISGSTILQNTGVQQLNRGRLQLAERYLAASKEELQGEHLVHERANLAHVLSFQCRVYASFPADMKSCTARREDELDELSGDSAHRCERFGGTAAGAHCHWASQQRAYTSHRDQVFLPERPRIQ